MKKISLWILFILFNSHNLFSQTEDDWTYFQMNGYVKDMHILGFGGAQEGTIYDNLIHNRLNFRYFGDTSWTVGLELRNRMFIGESVEMTPLFADLVSHDDGLVDLSWVILDNENIVLLTQIDRAWIEWSKEDWELRIGRQRINWGTNLFWNSNDLFNAFSLVDFDYEERPGVDALRFQRHFKNYSTLDLAVKPGKNSDDWIGAIRYHFNTNLYDIQLIGGWWFKDLVLGAGWAGSIDMTGFKGEISYFHPAKSVIDRSGSVSASISLDYVFPSQLFITGGFLFNSTGINENLGGEINQFLFEPTAKKLMFSKYNLLFNLAYPFNPLIYAGFTTVYSPGVHSLLIMPSLGYSISENWELAFYAQAFWLQQSSFDNIGNSLYLRIKGSF